MNCSLVDVVAYYIQYTIDVRVYALFFLKKVSTFKRSTIFLRLLCVWCCHLCCCCFVIFIWRTQRMRWKCFDNIHWLSALTRINALIWFCITNSVLRIAWLVWHAKQPPFPLYYRCCCSCYYHHICLFRMGAGVWYVQSASDKWWCE